MNALNFFDRLENVNGSYSNAIDDYFYLDGISEWLGYRRFFHFSDAKVYRDFTNSAHRILLTILKVVSYCSIVFPILFILAKTAHRIMHKFNIVEQKLPDAPYRIRKEDKPFIERIRQRREDKNYIPDRRQLIVEHLRGELPACQILKKPHLLYDFPQEVRQPEPEPSFFTRLIGRFKSKPNTPVVPPPIDEVEVERLEIQAEEQRLFARNLVCIEAQGVEFGKGGIVNLLNIMLEGLTVSPWTGSLVNGDPSWAAGPHGPYYVIIDRTYCPASAKNRLDNMMIEESMHAAYLVPTQRHRKILLDAIREAIKRGFVTPQEGLSAMNRIVTFKEFNDFPDFIMKDRRKLRLAVMRKAAEFV